MANGSYSLLGPMNTRPYALGERPGPSTVPLIPLMSGQDAFDSLEGYYRGGSRMDSLLNPTTNKMLGGPRGTNMPHTKIAELYKAAGGKLGDMVLKAIAGSKSIPLPPGKLYPPGVPKIPSKLPGFGGRPVPNKVWPPAPEVLPNKAVPTEGVLAHAKPKPPAPPKPTSTLADWANTPLDTKYTGPAVTPPGAGPITPRPTPVDASGLVKKLLAGAGITGAGVTVAGLATGGDKAAPAGAAPYTPPTEPKTEYPKPGAISSFMSNHGGKLIGGVGLAGLAALAYNRMNQQPDEDEEEIVAEPKKRRLKVASMQEFAERHQFVAGFLARCSEEDLNDQQIAYAIKEAAAIDPRIKRFFKEAGFWDSLGKGVTGAGNFLKGGVTAMGGGLGTAIGSVGSLGARAIDGVAGTNLTPAADTFTKGMVDATHSGMATAGSALSLDPTTPDQAAANWKLNPGGKTQGVDAMRADHNRQLHSMSPNDTLLGMSPSQAAGAHGLANDVSDTASLMAVTGGTPAANMAKAPAAVARMIPWAGPTLAKGIQAAPKFISGLAAYQGAPGQVAFGALDAAKTGDPSKMVPDAYTQGAVHPDKATTVPYLQDGEMRQTLHDGRQVAMEQVGPDGLGPAPGKAPPTGAPPAQPNPAQAAMKTDEAKQLVQTQPEQAQQYLDQAKTFVTEKFGQAKQQIEAWLPELSAGKTPAELAKASADKLAPSFGEQTMDIVKNMDPWQHVALWGGLGLGAIGIISAMTDEEGGIGGWLMALLGLGGAALGAGHAGLLGEGAQGVAKNVTGGAAKMMGSGFAQMPDSAMQMTMKGLPSMAPELAAKLDAAAGVGGMLNSGLGMAGQLTGETVRKMGEYGIPPDQVDRVLANWRQARKAG